jgi:hypothetical protein
MNNEPINMTATIDRRIATLRADAAALANPIMPATISRPAPRPRNRYRRRRTIR